MTSSISSHNLVSPWWVVCSGGLYVSRVIVMGCVMALSAHADGVTSIGQAHYSCVSVSLMYVLIAVLLIFTDHAEHIFIDLGQVGNV